MAQATWRPDLGLWCAFNADPNDPNATPTWTDLLARLRTADAVKRGRQYELDQNQAGQPTLTLWDVDEYLNPGNTAAPSPYLGNVLPYRQMLFMGAWPNPAAGNLLNTGASGNPDPSFESYTNGAAAPSWLTAVGGVTATITTTNPQQGTKDVTWTVANGATVQGIAVTVVAMPGRQYTASAHVRQSSASTQRISETVTATNGTSTTTTGSYVRLSVTFTATQPSHTIRLATEGTAVAGTINFDAVQFEPGASATTFTTSGSVIYPVFRDYVERWPSTWDHAGFLGLAEITCVDALATLAQVALHSEYGNSAHTKSPTYLWRLAEPSGSTQWADSSGNNGPSLVEFVSPSGAGTLAAGASTAIVGDPGGAGVTLVPSGSTGTGLGNPNGQPISVGQTGTGWGLTFAIWMAFDNTSTGGTGVILQKVGNNTDHNVQLAFSSLGKPEIDLYGDGVSASAASATATNDGTWHLYVGTVAVGASTTTITLYVDGTSVATTTTNNSTLFPGGTVDLAFTYTQVGGGFNGSTGSVIGQQKASYAWHLLWTRALSAGEITDLRSAGVLGYAGETSGARVSRYLGYSYTGTSVVATGQSTMGAGTVTEGTSALAAIQQVTLSENGNFWIDSSGRPTFASRTARYLATTSSYTFGESTSGGEYPYEGDLQYDYDPTLVYNDVTVTRTGGIIASAVDTTSQQRYFKRGYQRTIDISSDNETIDAANYLLAQHRQPRQRVAQIVLDPAATPSLWPVVLAIEVGTRVTVKRRAKAANGGVGLTMSGGFFVESIEHGGIDMDAGTWNTTLLLSPVDLSQVGILDDATYGLLDSTLILAY